MVKKALTLILTIALIVGLGGGIGCKPLPPHVVISELVPQEASLVMDIDLHYILNDEDIRGLLDEIAASQDEPQTVDEILDQFEAETGIDPRDFSRALVFGADDLEDYGAIMLTGDFNQSDIIASVEQGTGEELTPSNYKNHTIYQATVDETEVAICFLSDDTALGGVLDAVKDVIDIVVGDAEPLSGPIAQVYESLGDAWFKIVGEVPEEVGEPGWDEDIPVEEITEDLQVAGLALDNAGESISLIVKLYFSNPATASVVMVVIVVAKTFIALDPDTPPEVAELLEELEVDIKGSWLTLTVTATADELESLIESIGE